MASVGTIKYKNGSSWVDILHPVNSFYISYASTSPANLFDGTWTQVTDAALRGATGTGYVGSDSHTLTTNEMPSHKHQWGANCVYTTADEYPCIPDRRYTQAWWYAWAANSTTNSTGGGQHTQLCNAPSIVISGIVLRKSKRVI